MKESAMPSIRDLVQVRRGITAARLRKPLTAGALAIAPMIAISAFAVTASPASAGGGLAYLDARPPVQARVSDLLGRMTLPEKIGQMVQIEVTQVTDTNPACTSQGGFNLPN